MVSGLLFLPFCLGTWLPILGMSLVLLWGLCRLRALVGSVRSFGYGGLLVPLVLVIGFSVLGLHIVYGHVLFVECYAVYSVFPLSFSGVVYPVCCG